MEPKQLAIDSQEDSADMQERLLAIVMEVVGVFLWTSVLEGSHREVGKIDAQFTAHAAAVNVLMYITIALHYREPVECLCLFSLSLVLSTSVLAGLEEFLPVSGHVLSRPQLAHSSSHDQTTVSVHLT